MTQIALTDMVSIKLSKTGAAELNEQAKFVNSQWPAAAVKDDYKAGDMHVCSLWVACQFAAHSLDLGPNPPFDYLKKEFKL